LHFQEKSAIVADTMQEIWKISVRTGYDSRIQRKRISYSVRL